MPNTSARNSNKFVRRVNVLFADKGMFISRLDRPWIDTPFWLQGFFLRTNEELEAIRKYCNSIYIDISRGIEAEFYMEEDLELPTSEFLEKEIVKKKNRFRYKNKLSLKDEIETAKAVLEVATNKFYLVMDNIQNGKTLGMRMIPYFIQPMFESVMRNSEALLLLIRLRDKNNLTYYHGVDACVMALSFGKFMGMPIDEIHKLATGALLLDIGKVNVSESILYKTEPLTDKEYGKVCSHVEHGVKFLRQDENMDEDIINMVLAHHERSDGSGYPNGLKEVRIPAFARIAGVIDCYNAMCSKRPYHQSLTPFDSIQELYKLRKQHFQAELVEKFMHCMGIYPNGSLVEFKTGEVGVVLAQNYDKRNQPQIMLLLTSDKQANKNFKIIDMRKQPVTDSGKLLVIVKILKQNDFNIDLTTIYQKLKIVLPDKDFQKINVVSSVTDKTVLMLERNWSGFLASIKNLFVKKTNDLNKTSN
ncbi:MAG: HD-GYP domain-containing protein [Methylococcales bacterium]